MIIELLAAPSPPEKLGGKEGTGSGNFRQSCALAVATAQLQPCHELYIWHRYHRAEQCKRGVVRGLLECVKFIEPITGNSLWCSYYDALISMEADMDVAMFEGTCTIQTI